MHSRRAGCTPIRQKWVPILKSHSAAFPSATVWSGLASSFSSIFPVPLLGKPQCGAKSTSHRMRVRRSGKLDLWRSANNVISTLNCLDEGHCRHRTLARHKPEATLVEGSPPTSTELCHRRVHSLVLRESLRLRTARRDTCPTGAHAVAALLKQDKVDRYGSAIGSMSSQISLIASEVDEPPPGRHVSML